MNMNQYQQNFLKFLTEEIDKEVATFKVKTGRPPNALLLSEQFYNDLSHAFKVNSLKTYKEMAIIIAQEPYVNPNDAKVIVTPAVIIGKI